MYPPIGLGAFDPGLQRAADAGIRVSRQPYPDGNKGIALSLDTVAAKIREGMKDPDVIGWARTVLHARGIDGRDKPPVRVVAQALLDELRSATIYTQDAVNTEVIQGAAATLCLRPGLCLRGGDCFPEGTLLLRDDYTFVPIGEIKVGERVWGYGAWTSVEAKQYKGLLPVDVLHLNNGSSLALTGGHHVFVSPTERARVSDVTAGTHLLQPERIAFGGRADMDPDRALVEGLYVSDGWSEKYRFSISGQDGQPKEEQKRIVKSICDRLGIPTSWQRKHIRVNDPEWTLRMQQMGAHAPEKRLLSIDMSEACAAATLRGVMADSGANTNGSGRTFTSTSRLLTLQTRVLHRMFGVSCSTRYIEDHGGLGKNPIWRLGVRATVKVAEKRLGVKEIDRALLSRPCWDIQTSDHYVYLPENDVTVSNCDDLVVAIGSGLMGIGLPVRVVKQSWGAGQQEHVIVHVQDEYGVWLPIDPSDKSMPVGQSHHAVSEVNVDPLNPLPATYAVGAGGAELVTLGGVPGTELPPGGCFPSPGYGAPGYPSPMLGPVIDTAWDPRSRSFRAHGFGQVPPLPPPPSPYAQAQTDIASMQATIGAGDTYASSSPPEYAQALQTYQAAGQAGATVVGPDIDLAGAPNVTQPLTQQAWNLNAQLAALTGDTQAVASQAGVIAKQMLALYQQAVASGLNALGGTSPGATPSGVGGPGGVSTAGIVLGMLGAGALAGIIYAAVKRHPAHVRENPTPVARASKGGQFSWPGGARGRRMHRVGKCPHCNRGAREGHAARCPRSR